MIVDKSSFLIIAAALAAGAGGGYVASERGLLGGRGAGSDAPPIAATAAPVVIPSAAPTVIPPPPPEKPACDDSTGSPGVCPPAMGPAEEGGCGDLPTKKCNDFKKSFEPKVAENAVACLSALKMGDRCDATHLNLCGHLALMSACTAPGDGDAPMAGASVQPGSVEAFCNVIVGACSTGTAAPNMRDCRATLAGMNDVGRNAMVDCMKTHCSDKGLLGCEAVPSGGAT